jgi:hypothetical protein
MSKSKSVIIGEGEQCPKCGKPMQCRESKNPNAYYRQFDYCPFCPRVQFYKEFINKNKK